MGLLLDGYSTRAGTVIDKVLGSRPRASSAELAAKVVEKVRPTFEARAKRLRELAKAVGAGYRRGVLLDGLSDEVMPSLRFEVVFWESDGGSDAAFDLLGNLQDDAREYQLSVSVTGWEDVWLFSLSCSPDGGAR
jgi:hypothetical protein